MLSSMSRAVGVDEIAVRRACVQSSESRFDAIARCLTDEAMTFARVATWELDIATGRIHASRAWSEIWGLGPGEENDLDAALGRVHPADREPVVEALRAAAETGEAFQVRFRILRSDGLVRWVESTGHLEAVGPGLAGRMYGAIIDITDRRDVEQALARYADLVSASPDRIAFVDRGCRVLAANDAFLRAVERPRSQVIGRAFGDIVEDRSLRDLIYRSFGACLDRGAILVEDVRESARCGGFCDLEVRLFPHYGDEGVVNGVAITLRDVSRVREAERRLLQSAAVYDATSEGVLITDARGSIVAVNQAFTQITGYTQTEVLGHKPSLLDSQWHSRSFFFGMLRLVLRYGYWDGEFWNRRKDGEIYLQRLSVRRVLDGGGKLVNFVAVFAGCGASSKRPGRIEQLFHYDPLTKLPNRLLFESRLEHAIEIGRRQEAPLALCLFDLDSFSNINRSLGHQIGDELLRAVALRLREVVRPADTLARLHADLFGLLVETIRHADEVRAIARRLQASLVAPFSLRGHELFVTASVGVTFDAGLDAEPRAILTRAESALRLVKRQGGNGMRVSTPELGDPAREEQCLVDRLREGLQADAYALLYRPRVDIGTGRCQGVEALIRWNRPELGAFPPEHYLPLLKDGGFMVELGQWALQAACRQLRDWLERGFPLASLSMGVSEAQLMRGDLVRTLGRLLEDHGLEPSRLELEVSESLLLKHLEQMTEVLHGLSGLGVRLALCDVGASWIAPAVLQRLPIATLAIHPTFVECLPDSKFDLAVVQALIAMGQALGLVIRADGVRTEDQRLLLQNIGCAEAHGDLFAEPLPAAEFERRLEPRSARWPSTPVKN